MSTRTTLRPMDVITAGDMSALSITSLVTVLQSLTHVGYGYSWAGTSPIGTLSVQVSNDYALNPDNTVKNAGTWTSIYMNVNGTPATTIAVTGNTGTGFVDIADTSAYAIRTVYNRTSGSGSLTATIVGKVA